MSVIDDAVFVASLFAVDPAGIGGICLRSQIHPARDQWLRLLRDLLPADAPLRRIPSNIGDSRLLGGLDLAATLIANRPIAERGVLADSDGGVVVISMAERMSTHTAACLGAVLDVGEVMLMREALAGQFPARLGVVALDEGIGEDEFVPPSLLDRLAFLMDFEGLSTRACFVPKHDSQQILAARQLLPAVRLDEEVLERLCGTALALGVGSARVSLLAARVARISAALHGRERINEEDAVVAGRLVLAPRATVLPQNRSDEPPDPPSAANAEPPHQSGDRNSAAEPPPVPADGHSALEPPPPSGDGNSGLQPPLQSADHRSTPEPPPSRAAANDDFGNNVLAASRAAIPAGLLTRLKCTSEGGRSKSSGAGRAGNQRYAAGRGRPTGVRSGPPRGHQRLNVLETLRAAAPWQRVRGRRQGDVRIRVTPSDFRVTSCRQRSRTLTIFAVDASGSAALNRLAEAKGAVELLLAECYMRRDEVAVISFRGRTAELLLPPTRSLVRAKRSLASMPGGGATPLAAAIAAAVTLATQAQRRGETPTLVVLSDGRANVARDGSAGREVAHRDALAASTAVRLSKIQALFVDTSPRPNALANALASAMNAGYIPLPFASSQALSDIVKTTAALSRTGR